MVELAARGGPKACPPGTIPTWPIHGPEEAAALSRVLESGHWWRMDGGEVEAFEVEFARYLGCEKALAVSSGTHALELALSALGIGFGDEVIVPGFTFAATATAVLAVGAVPVIVDVDPSVYCIEPAAVEAAITPRTRALIPVHMAGHACAMEPLLALAKRHRLRVIADAAHAHGTRWRGDSVARLADVAIYSFQAFKLMSAGEGGALVTDDPELIARAWLRHSCGRPRGDRRYQHLTLGSNHRMTEFQGTILRAQLARLPAQLATREAACGRLDERLAAIPGLHPMGRDRDTTLHAHYMYMARVDAARFGCARDELVALLIAEGVPAYRSYRTIADLELFHEGAPWPGQPPLELTTARLGAAVRRHPLPVSRALAADALWIHHAALLGEASVQDAVAAAFEKIAAHVRAGRSPRASAS